MKKKQYLEFPKLKEFLAGQSVEINAEYMRITDELEQEGKLEYPQGEKVEKDLFAIRIISAGNVRVFYVYAIQDRIYGIHGYVKKTQTIPQKELEYARKIVRELKRQGAL
ncbi:MAG TPA: hypothetical protein DET40_25090 [Lentisphaeria bacterium]|nr:MAG: hypothetical protein A2X45_18870 [Lentisphaerae bacterium GWF2_50_93]HCE46836.1 hypothetical protein [Lentisphaeria bacterium]